MLQYELKNQTGESVTSSRQDSEEGAERVREPKGKSTFTTQQERPTYFQLRFNWLLKKKKKKM